MSRVVKGQVKVGHNAFVPYFERFLNNSGNIIKVELRPNIRSNSNNSTGIRSDINFLLFHRISVIQPDNIKDI